jgi:hypothetical protein
MTMTKTTMLTKGWSKVTKLTEFTIGIQPGDHPQERMYLIV